MNETRDLAEFAATIDIGAAPEGMQHKLKIHVADTLGAMVHGSRTEVADLMSAFAVEHYSSGRSRIAGRTHELDSCAAALVNGTQAHAFELDDYHPGAKSHPGAVVVPAALAIAAETKPTGVEFLSAVLAGYEVMIRISLAADASVARRRGWHLTGVVGPFGAAAAAGKLLGLNAHEMANAFGIAASHGGGVFAFSQEGSMTKRMHAGRAAEGGLSSALLARDGFTGPTRVLEAADGGFVAAISDGVDLSRATKGLGSEFVTEGTSIKPYSCCASIHSSIDALLALVNAEHLQATDIDRITLGNSRLVAQQCYFDYTGLGGTLEAQMNLQFCVAVAAIDGEVFVEQFEPESMRREDVRELASRVDFDVDAEIDAIYPRAFPARVSVTTKDGRTLESHVSAPTGSPDLPYQWADVERKLTAVTRRILGDDQSARLLQAVSAIDDAPALDAVLDNLTPRRE